MSKRLSLGVRNIFSTHVNNKGLISIIHKMFLQIKIEKTSHIQHRQEN